MRKYLIMTALVMLTGFVAFNSTKTENKNINSEPVVAAQFETPKAPVVKQTAAEVLPGRTETKKGPAEKGQTSAATSKRVTWVVQAVRKTKDSIVTLKVSKKGSRNDTVGTGVIVDERGYIVTNKHVVSGGSEIKAVLADGSSYVGTVDFEDASQDLAVVKVDAPRKLKALRLGPTTDLEPGEPVVVIGNPYGYFNSVSTGIVSAIGREVDMGGTILKDLIQTTAPINPGNSGGPLMNADGELIGIVVALRGDAQNIAFAISAETVQRVLIRRLSASRTLGVYHGLDVREKVQSNVEERTQAVIHDVALNTPAAQAGLKEGDRIVQLGNLPIGNRFDLERSLWDVRKGEAVEVIVLRDGQQVKMSLKFDGEKKQTAAR